MQGFQCSSSLLFCCFFYWFKLFFFFFFFKETKFSSISFLSHDWLSVLWFSNLATWTTHDGPWRQWSSWLGGSRAANDMLSSLPTLPSLSAFAHAIPSFVVVSPLSVQEVPAAPPAQPLLTASPALQVLFNVIPDCQVPDQEDLVLLIVITLKI